MRVPTVSIRRSAGKGNTTRHAVFVNWSGESNTNGSRISEWLPEAGANVIAATIRGVLADAYHAGHADGWEERHNQDRAQ